MINVLYSGDRDVFKGMLLSCMSMVKKCSAPLNIYIMTMDITTKRKHYQAITAEQIDLLQNYIQQYNSESKVTLIDVKKYYQMYLENTPNENTEYSPFTCNRLYIDLAKEIPKDKLLYIDCDTMVLDDIRILYDTDISDYEFAAALDYMGKFWIAKDYFNAGVMLFNITKCIETGLLAKCRDIVSKKWLKMPDQSALYRSKSSILYLDSRFNEQRDIKENTVIKHFCKGIKYTPLFHIYNVKQWDIDKVHKKLDIYAFDDIYAEYQELLAKYPEVIANK